MCENFEIIKNRFGLGLAAARSISQGELVLRFEGELITKQQAIDLGDEGEANPLQVEPLIYRNLIPPSVYLNHSCEPNCGLVKDEWLMAIDDIRIGEELTFDYSTSISERRWTLKCDCKSPACRNVIGDFHDLPLPIQRRYLDLGIVQSYILDEIPESRWQEFDLNPQLARKWFEASHG